MADGVLGVFGENLDRLMNEQRVQNKELADALHMEQTAVSRWRNGKQGPDLSVVGQIASILRVPPYMLLLPQYSQDVALNALKIAGPGAGQVGMGDFARLLEMFVSSALWALSEKWGLPGARPEGAGARALEEIARQRAASQQPQERKKSNS